jgi:ssDNA-binding Zn-finger/Zn-ribbon topoisomerase 1
VTETTEKGDPPVTLKAKKGDPGVTRISESSSRSNNGEMMTIDGATHRAPLESPGAAPTVAVHAQIRERLGLDDGRVSEWIATRLDGRQPRNVDAYLLRCLDNQIADTAKAKATRGSAKKTAPKQESANAGGKQSKKAPAKKTGSKTCPDCGRDFSTARGLASHKSHHVTAQCPVCDKTVKARDLNDHRIGVHRAAFIRSIQDQPLCIHGVPGGNLPEPNGVWTSWRHCGRCQREAYQKRLAGQSSTSPLPVQAKPPTPKFSMHDWETERRSRCIPVRHGVIRNDPISM